MQAKKSIMITTIEVPDTKGLKEFGWLTGGILVGLFGILFPLAFNHEFPRWPWLIASMLWLWTLFWPHTLKPLYQAWMWIGQILGWLNTRIILGIIYYLIITPIGITKRLVGNNPLHPKPVMPHSYRHPTKPRPPKHLEYPF